MLTIVLHNITLIIQYDLVHNEFLENIVMSGKLFRYYSLYSVDFIMLGKQIYYCFISLCFLCYFVYFILLFFVIRTLLFIYIIYTFICSIMNVKLCFTLILSMLRSLLLDTP